MSFKDLTERERQILANLISHYVNTADPVGSRVNANRFKMGISSATIRNTLQDLEELGLLEQPHTSAGRIPTDAGYRVYVDYLLQPEQLTEMEKRTIKQSIIKEGRGINEILGQTAKVLGEISSQLGLTFAPRFEEGILKEFKLIALSQDKLMAVVVLLSGLARTIVLEIEASFSINELREVEMILNERLAGRSLAETRATIAERTADISGQGRLMNLVVDSSDKIWTEQPEGIIRISGTDRLVSMPEFADREKLSSLMKALENDRIISDFIAQMQDEGLVITIGAENKIDEIMSCSFVTSSYKVGNVTGTIGVIGPTRMPYNKLVSVVEYTAKSITKMLSGMKIKKG